MQSTLPTSLVSEWLSLPAEVRSAPASEVEVAAFERSHRLIPAEYRHFLLCCGGGPVGSEWIDGIEKLRETHAKFQREYGLSGWKNGTLFPIGWDGGGNPIGIDAAGAVVVEDHNFGGVHTLAPSFAAFLAKGLGHAL